jgi:hypothetical protein
MKQLPRFLIAAFFAGLLGCGGGHSQSQTTYGGGLTYQVPPAYGWRLIQDGATTKERLVLALVGPPGILTRGASITLLVDSNLATFATFPDGSYLQSTGHYVTTTLGKPDEAKNLQLNVGARMGNKLTVGIFQKELNEPAKSSDVPLFRIALTTVPGAPTGTPVSLILRKACVVTDDMAAANYLPVPIPVAIGRLTVQ